MVAASQQVRVVLAALTTEVVVIVNQVAVAVRVAAGATAGRVGLVREAVKVALAIGVANWVLVLIKEKILDGRAESITTRTRAAEIITMILATAD
jgi:hypothetical protein